MILCLFLDTYGWYGWYIYSSGGLVTGELAPCGFTQFYPIVDGKVYRTPLKMATIASKQKNEPAKKMGNWANAAAVLFCTHDFLCSGRYSPLGSVDEATLPPRAIFATKGNSRKASWKAGRFPARAKSIKIHSHDPSTSVAVGVLLERTIHPDADVVCLLLGELGEVRTQRWQVKSCHLLVQPWMIWVQTTKK